MKRVRFFTLMMAFLLLAAPVWAEDEKEGETEEKKGPLTVTDRIINRFMALDTDESETVSFQEYMVVVEERAKARFEAMDADKDGEVTDEEYRAFWKSRKSKHYRIKR